MPVRKAMYMIGQAVLCMALPACSRYEYVQSDPAPCRPPQTPPPASPAVFAVESPGVHGHILSSSRRLDGARVRVGGLVAVSDSVGQFALSPLAAGKTAIATERPGFDPRRDTIIVPDSGGLDVTIRLKAAWSPGVACQIALMTPQRMRKPWWKWW